MSANPATRPEPSDDGMRSRLATRMAHHLERVSHPRAQMALMVSATGSAGFFVDWLLLKAGIGRMSLRYVLAVLLSYVVFLLLIKLWLVFHFRRKARAGEGSGGSSWDFGISSGSGGTGSGGGGGGGGASSVFRAGGGGSGGGGASASFAEEGAAPMRAVAMPIPPPAPAATSSSRSSSSSSGGGFGLDLDGDEIVAIVAVVVAVAGAFVAAGYLVVQAPAIFGEVLLDGTLSAGLYKRLRTFEPHDWLETALRKTVLPFLAVALLAGVAGHFMQKAAPEARSIGGVFHHIAG